MNFCFGNVDFFSNRELIKVETPNIPLNKTKSGENKKLEFKIKQPKEPESKITKIAKNFLFFVSSKNIRRIIISINKIQI